MLRKFVNLSTEKKESVGNTLYINSNLYKKIKIIHETHIP